MNNKLNSFNVVQNTLPTSDKNVKIITANLEDTAISQAQILRTLEEVVENIDEGADALRVAADYASQTQQQKRLTLAVGFWSKATNLLLDIGSSKAAQAMESVVLNLKAAIDSKFEEELTQALLAGINQVATAIEEDVDNLSQAQVINLTYDEIFPPISK